MCEATKQQQAFNGEVEEEQPASVEMVEKKQQQRGWTDGVKRLVEEGRRRKKRWEAGSISGGSGQGLRLAAAFSLFRLGPLILSYFRAKPVYSASFFTQESC